MIVSGYNHRMLVGEATWSEAQERHKHKMSVILKCSQRPYSCHVGVLASSTYTSLCLRLISYYFSRVKLLCKTMFPLPVCIHGRDCVCVGKSGNVYDAYCDPYLI